MKVGSTFLGKPTGRQSSWSPWVKMENEKRRKTRNIEERAGPLCTVISIKQWQERKKNKRKEKKKKKYGIVKDASFWEGPRHGKAVKEEGPKLGAMVPPDDFHVSKLYYVVLV